MYLTVAVPTYNRPREVESIVKQWSSLSIPSSVELLISDNCSDSFLFDNYNLTDLEASNIRIIRTEKNIGMTGNLLHLFQHSKGTYVLVSSDEDRVISSAAISELIKNLKKTNFYYYSTPFRRNNLGKVYNYTGIGQNKFITIGEFHAANFYLSGGVYKRDESLSVFEKVNNLKEKFVCAHLYPHSLVTAHFLLANKRCAWLNIPVIEEGVNLRPISSMPDKRPYNHISSRFEQFTSFLSYLDCIEFQQNSKEQTENLIKMRRSLELNLILWLRWGLATTDIKLLASFDKSLFRSCLVILKHKVTMIISRSTKTLYTKVNETTKATWLLTKYGKK